MESVKELLILLVASSLVSNVVLSQFLGLCPFLGVSKKTNTAAGMGVAVIFVITLASAVAGALNKFVLQRFHVEYLETIVFILVIAFLVQLLEIVIKKIAPALYQALGVFLPLITTNCAVLGVAILVIQKDFNLIESVIYGFSTAVGFTLALWIFAGIREQLEITHTPKALRGIPLALICAGILAMAFMGFSGIKIG